MSSIPGLGHWQCNNEHFRLSVSPVRPLLCFLYIHIHGEILSLSLDFPSRFLLAIKRCIHRSVQQHLGIGVCICASVDLCISAVAANAAWPNVGVQVVTGEMSFFLLIVAQRLCGKLHPRPLLNISAAHLLIYYASAILRRKRGRKNTIMLH